MALNLLRTDATFTMSKPEEWAAWNQFAFDADYFANLLDKNAD